MMTQRMVVQQTTETTMPFLLLSFMWILGFFVLTTSFIYHASLTIFNKRKPICNFKQNSLILSSYTLLNLPLKVFLPHCFLKEGLHNLGKKNWLFTIYKKFLENLGGEQVENDFWGCSIGKFAGAMEYLKR